MIFVNAQVSFDIPLRIEVLIGRIQLRPLAGGRFEGAIPSGLHEAFLSLHEQWIRIPQVRNLDLPVRVWKAHWDDLRVEVYEHIQGQWKPLEEANWQSFLREGVP